MHKKCELERNAKKGGNEKRRDKKKATFRLKK